MACSDSKFEGAAQCLEQLLTVLQGGGNSVSATPRPSSRPESLPRGIGSPDMRVIGDTLRQLQNGAQKCSPRVGAESRPLSAITTAATSSCNDTPRPLGLRVVADSVLGSPRTSLDSFRQPTYSELAKSRPGTATSAASSTWPPSTVGSAASKPTWHDFSSSSTTASLPCHDFASDSTNLEPFPIEQFDHHRMPCHAGNLPKPQKLRNQRSASAPLSKRKTEPASSPAYMSVVDSAGQRHLMPRKAEEELAQCRLRHPDEVGFPRTLLQKREEKLAAQKLEEEKRTQNLGSEIESLQVHHRVELDTLRDELQSAKEQRQQLSEEKAVWQEKAERSHRQIQELLSQLQAEKERHAQEEHGASVELTRLTERLREREAELAQQSGNHKVLEKVAPRLQEREAELSKAGAEQMEHVLVQKRASVELDEVAQRLQKCESDLDRTRVEAATRAEELRQIKSQFLAQGEEFKRFREMHKQTKASVQVQEEALAKENRDNIAELDKALHEKTYAMKRLQAESEREIEDCIEFGRRLAFSSAYPALERNYDFSRFDILGMGNYGFAVACHAVGKDGELGDKVVLKLMSDRWANVAIREWGHGSSMRAHPNIVEHRDLIMHRDAHRELQHLLKAGFEQGVLTGREPEMYPQTYFCLVLEYMDSGTVGDLVDRGLMTLEISGAIARQVASALAFVHKSKRTHNDIKPTNVLVRVAEPGGDRLVAKLCDFGLTQHSADRERDFELFAYMIWCLVTGRAFTRAPSSQDEREEALSTLAKHRASGPREIFHAVRSSIAGMWRGEMSMVEVEKMPALQGLTVPLPPALPAGNGPKFSPNSVVSSPVSLGRTLRVPGARRVRPISAPMGRR